MNAVHDADIRRHYPIVEAVIAHLQAEGQLNDSLGLEDLQAVGLVGLWKGLQRYDQDRGAKLSTWLWYQVAWAIMDALRRSGRATGWTRRLKQVAEVGSLEQPTDDERTVGDGLMGPFDTAETAMARVHLEWAVRQVKTMSWSRRCAFYGLLAGEPLTVTAARAGRTVSAMSLAQTKLRRELSWS